MGGHRTTTCAEGGGGATLHRATTLFYTLRRGGGTTVPVCVPIWAAKATVCESVQLGLHTSVQFRTSFFKYLSQPNCFIGPQHT